MSDIYAENHQLDPHEDEPSMKYAGDKTDVTALVKYAQSLEAENERLRAAVEDAVETLEAMDMHIDNPLYARLRDALEQSGPGDK